MSCGRNVMHGLLRCGAWGAVSLAAWGQTAPRIAPVPRDAMELASREFQTADTPAAREPALQLLARARKNFALRSGGQGYDLKVSFTVDSQGQTNYDGAWEMEDLFAPGVGHRWTATAASGYTTTGIARAGEIFQDGTASDVPLRLLEARGVLFDPMQSPAYADRGSIRTATGTFHGATVTCLLLSPNNKAVHPGTGRDWDEAEECIDPQSGLVQMHSEVPGRYAAFDYTNAPQLGGHVLPRSVTISEAGRIVSRISVESLQGMPAADPALFEPTDAMKAKGPAVAMTSATKVSRVHGQAPPAAPVTLRPVCVFGMVTSTGQLVEAHALQPSDPNSQAALEDARKINFSPPGSAGTPARQHFVFVIEKFAAPQ